MIPQIFSLGPIPVNSFGLCIALALLIGITVLTNSFKVNGLNPELAEKYVISAGITGLIGARIWYIITFYPEIKGNLLGAIFSTSGFVFYGGFIFASILLYFMAKKDKLNIASFVDSLGPALALGYAIGRLGCQLSGDGDYGKITDSILGMSYSTGVIPTAPGVLVFPTPLYESILSILIFVYLFRIEKNTDYHKPYLRFSLYLILMACERFIIEFFRVNTKVLGGLSEAQVIALVLMFIGGVLFYRYKKIGSKV
jgi:phosphatidylglycerol:prolipoprotein diacylglycerol transferase